MVATKQPLLINYNWHHAVNDQSKLNQVLEKKSVTDNNGADGRTTATTDAIEAIEADIIFSEVKSQAVMGHPPLRDSDLTLASFLHQLSQAKFQQHCSSSTNNPAETEFPVLKLDFKSMTALKSSLPDIDNYLDNFPSCLRRRVWINADVLPGPGEDLNDATAQEEIQPKFEIADFLQVVTTALPGTVLSIGWTTSLTDIGEPYTDTMVSSMIEFAKPHTEVTFPVRASCFVKSWGALQKLYQINDTWTLTLWWSHELAKEEFDRIYWTLENDEKFRNRTYYDLFGFRNYLSMSRYKGLC